MWVCLSTLLIACEHEESDTSFKGTRTILAYIAADNTLASFASLDLAEMKAGMAKVQDSNVHFLVYIDDGKSPRLLELKNEKGAVVETVVETYGSRNSVGVSETQEVFAKVFSNSNIRLTVMDWFIGHMVMGGYLIRCALVLVG